ncbi:MAG: hypothetical protein WDN27_06975 [Candidatus Saccharibacteria bacterium]
MRRRPVDVQVIFSARYSGRSLNRPGWYARFAYLIERQIGFTISIPLHYLANLDHYRILLLAHPKTMTR